MESFFARGPVNAIVGGKFTYITKAEWVVLSEFHNVMHGHWGEGPEGERKAKAFAWSMGNGAVAVKVRPFWYCSSEGQMHEFSAKQAMEAYEAYKAQKETA